MRTNKTICHIDMKREKRYAHAERDANIWNDYYGMTDDSSATPAHVCRECMFYVPGGRDYNCSGMGRLITIGPLKPACEKFKEKK